MTAGVGIAAALLVLSALQAGDARSAAPRPCRAAELVLQLGPQVGEATGQHSLTLRLVNLSRSPCSLDGYPRVLLLDATGALPFAITHHGDEMVTSRPPRRLVVEPARAAFVLLNHYRCDRGVVRTALVVRLGLPGSRATMSLPLADPYDRPTFCGPGDPGSTLAVSPFEPTLRATLHR